MSQHHHTTAAEYGTSPKNFKTYVLGFIGCIILTLISFGAVSVFNLSPGWTYATLLGSALLQLIVQSVCFLRLNVTKSGIDNTVSFVFILLVVLILVGGSMWIMWHLNYNMM